MSDRLRSQVAVITGGGSGIGRAIALALSAAGAAIAVAGRRLGPLEETLALAGASPTSAVAIRTDITERDSVLALLHETSCQLGTPTVLVNAAGVMGPVGALWECDPEEWWRCLETNLRGSVLCCSTVIPMMLAGTGGRIINIASRFGLRAAPGGTAYACSKAAVFRLTDSLAAELEATSVRVFAMAPGPVRTALTEWPPEIFRWQPDLADRAWMDPAPAGQLAVDLASGAWDDFNGRYVHVQDDHEAMLRDRARVLTDDLQTLRLRGWRPMNAN